MIGGRGCMERQSYDTIFPWHKNYFFKSPGKVGDIRDT